MKGHRMIPEMLLATTETMETYTMEGEENSNSRVMVIVREMLFECKQNYRKEE